VVLLVCDKDATDKEMKMITYEKFLGGERVNLDGKVVGVIQTVPGGFAYIPKGSKITGETFTTVAGVKRSLEGRDE
jgi:hypothetical protein